MPDAVERRTAAFYEWEIRGRGWLSFEEPVCLAPPLIPVTREWTEATTAIDDARKPTMISRMVESLFQRPAPKVEPPPALEQPEYQPFSRQSVIREYDILVPSEESLDPGAMNTWLQSIGSGRAPIAFEIIAHEGSVTLRVAAEERDAAAMREYTRAFFPSVSLRVPNTSLADSWTNSGGEIVGAIEFGLAREFMLPLRPPDKNGYFLSSLLGSLGILGESDIAILQFLLHAVDEPWADHAMRAVTTPDGQPFFADAPELTKLAEEKCEDPLFAVAMRAIVSSDSYDAAEDALLGIVNSLRTCGTPERNEITPLPVLDVNTVVTDVLERVPRRTGALLSLSDLRTLLQLPGDHVSSSRLRRASGSSKGAPKQSREQLFTLGLNDHDGVQHTVGLSVPERLKHCHIVGASGTGKSTLLRSMIAQDIESGTGFALLDPHGDLCDEVLARIPIDRVEDVAFLDPADEQYSFGFNVLSAHSELARTLLSSDFVGVFRRFSRNFGDQMEAVLANAVLAMLEHKEGGTLLDLRQFLLDSKFRADFLKLVRDPQVRSYWRDEFPLLKGSPHAPILTRLNAFLRPKLIRAMVSQRDDRLNVRSLMDNSGILLARLSHGAIGEENAYLLGSLLTARIAQAALSRQNESEESRVPFHLYIDEFHHFLTPSIVTILAGTRKYGLSLTLAHQSMRQLRNLDGDVASAVMGNAHTRIVFRVGDEDAHSLASGFSSFTQENLQRLGVGEAIVRIGQSDHDFNLRTMRPDPVPRDLARIQREQTVAASRGRFARSLVADDEPTISVNVEHAGAQVEPTSPVIEPEAKASAPHRPGRGGARHKYLQSLIKRLAEDRGFSVQLERTVLEGHGHVDVCLQRDDLVIACEVSVTTSVRHEVGNLTKCLAAGFNIAVLVCGDAHTLRAARDSMSGASDGRLRFIQPEEIPAFLDEPGPSAQGTANMEPPSLRNRSGNIAKLHDGGREVGSLGVHSKKRLIISRDAAAYIGLAPQTLAKLRVTGGSPQYFKIGRQVVYDQADLDAWLSVRRRRSTSDSSGI